MTPAAVARLVASPLEFDSDAVCLLDAGAGVGSLTAAVVDRILSADIRPRRVVLTAFEIEQLMHEELGATLAACRSALEAAGIRCDTHLRSEDFLQYSIRVEKPEFNIAILNPPYRKLSTRSRIYEELRKAEIATPNLYAVFWAGAIAATVAGGQVVAITPRSFCNGTYFKSFREYLIKNTSFRWLHTFESRDRAFSEDDVLQENLITYVIRDGRADKVRLTSSMGPDGGTSERVLAASDVVHADDPERFIRLPAAAQAELVRDRINRFSSDLKSLGIAVSTGKVVDFRVKSHLRREPGNGTVPLIYPGHFGRDGQISWPREAFRKPNALVLHDQTRRQLNRNGWYTLVKRFSAKEEKRRVVAALYDGSIDCELLGFENHLNYLHCKGEPLDEGIAKGLAVFLNSTLVDEYLLQFSGHTQVNAGDLRSLRFPNVKQLLLLGQGWAPGLDQESIDALVASIETFAEQDRAKSEATIGA